MKKLLLICVAVLLFQNCKIADLRTPEINTNSPNREEKAVQLLERVITNYNLDKLAEAESYSLKATDNWRGLYAIVNPFPKDNALMELRYRPNSFDGQFNYLESNNKNVYGVQSFNHYKIDEKGVIKFKKKESVVFTLPAIQYFFELPLRLQNAPILKYAGTQEFEGKVYDLVFATWERLEPHKEHDQYLLYLDRNTGNLSFASYTVRGMYLPAPKNIFGSIRFAELNTNPDGITYPSKMFIQLNKLKKEKRTLHTVTVDDLRINSFELSKLYPDRTIEFVGDVKR